MGDSRESSSCTTGHKVRSSLALHSLKDGLTDYPTELLSQYWSSKLYRSSFTEASLEEMHAVMHSCLHQSTAVENASSQELTAFKRDLQKEVSLLDGYLARQTRAGDDNLLQKLEA